MKILMRLFGACLAVTAVATARAADDQKQDRPFTDAEFVKMAASSGMHEFELGKIGQMKGVNPEVKTFSERVEADHRKVNDELKMVAREAGFEFPLKMEAEHEKHVNHFREYKGENFDRDFIKHMVGSHEKGVALFTKAAKEAKNEKLKEFALKTLPTLKEHLDQAKKLQVQLEKK